MSQAKVDRYKKEKKNRAKEIKKKKVIKAVWVIVIALFVGACIGYPLGKKLYKVNAEKRKANETVTTAYYDAWMSNYWKANYSEKLGLASGDTEDATGTDADYSTSTDASDIDETGVTPIDAD